jgi:hypothetical protein
MADTALAVMDNGEANKRILSNTKYKTDFRSVEGASLKRKTALASPEGKRMFGRCFYSFQVNAYVVSAIGRTKLPRETIEQIEQTVRAKLEAAAKELDRSIDGAEALLKQNNIDDIASYDTAPLERDAAITSGLGRRYFELIHKLDQVMPLIQTLEIWEVLNERQADQERSHCKRVVIALASSVRNFAAGVRRRMNELDEKVVAAAPPVQSRKASAEAQGGEPVLALDDTSESTTGGDSGTVPECAPPHVNVDVADNEATATVS